MAAKLESVAMPKILRWHRWREPLLGYGLILPSLALFALFTYLPLLLMFVLSLYHGGLALSQDTFAGADNYLLLLHSPSFWQSIAVSAYFVIVAVPATVGLGVGLALLLWAGPRRMLPGLGAMRAAVFLPYVTPMIATSITWTWIFNSRYGLANWLLGLLHLAPLRWLSSTTWALPAVMMNYLWHNVGFAVVVYLAGLSLISPEVLEAARVDGASPAQVFRSVLWPLLSPTTVFVVIASTLGTLQNFSQIYSMTSGQSPGSLGGPLGSTTTLAVYLYKAAFIYFHFSYGAAVATVLFLLLLGLTVLQKRIGDRLSFYD